jgi:hypothetical protein
MGGEPETEEIRLSIDGIASGAPETRAVVDRWNDTPVSIAYEGVNGATSFSKALTVNIADEGFGSDKHINTGLVYPGGNAPVSFVGYHPAQTPNANGPGVVGYDLSAGTQDVMLSNTLTGSQLSQIAGTMKFEHQLTRFTFLMNCKFGETYPETVHGVRAMANTSKPLMTYLYIDLNTRNLNFFLSGQVTNILPQGAVVPSYTGSSLVFDLMIQPGVPVTFGIVTLTGVRTFTVTMPDTLWDTLLLNGGEAGKQYTIKLTFSGEEIVSQGISVTSWSSVVNAGNNPTWY